MSYKEIWLGFSIPSFQELLQENLKFSSDFLVKFAVGMKKNKRILRNFSEILNGFKDL